MVSFTISKMASWIFGLASHQKQGSATPALCLVFKVNPLCLVFKVNPLCLVSNKQIIE